MFLMILQNGDLCERSGLPEESDLSAVFDGSVQLVRFNFPENCYERAEVSSTVGELVFNWKKL